MEQNIIFYFSGTGNSLKAAKDIAKSLKNCRLVSMGKPCEIIGAYDRVGFVFPTYAMGPPQAVTAFIRRLDLSENSRAFFFTVVTCGSSAGNCISIINRLLRNKGLSLQYGKPLVMFANYVGLYDMAKDPEQKAAASAERLKPIIQEIVNKSVGKPPATIPIINLFHSMFISRLSGKDKNFKVSAACKSCRTCEKVCPVGNITMSGGKPSYKHNCQRCMACVQWCPSRAIDYKKKTQKRGRYHHPDITVKDMTER